MLKGAIYIRQHMKNKTMFFRKLLSTGRLDTHLAKSLHPRVQIHLSQALDNEKP